MREVLFIYFFTKRSYCRLLHNICTKYKENILKKKIIRKVFGLFHNLKIVVNYFASKSIMYAIIINWNRMHAVQYHTLPWLKSSLRKLYGWYNDLVRKYSVSFWHMLTDVFPYFLDHYIYTPDWLRFFSSFYHLDNEHTVGVTYRRGCLLFLVIWSHLYLFRGRAALL